MKLLEVERTPKVRLTDCTAIVLLPNDECRRCGGEVEERTFDQPALLRHGGYGATERTTFGVCVDCDHVRLIETTEVRPARDVA